MYGSKHILLALVISFIFPNFLGQTKLDTVCIYDTNNIMPSTVFRNCQFENGDFYIDSIKYLNIKINKGYQSYYLKIFNKDSILIKEGDYFDAYPNGVYKEYNLDGNIMKEYNYSLTAYKKPKKIICRAISNDGRKKYKSTQHLRYESQLIYPRTFYEYTYKKLNKKVELEENSKTITTYDSNGNVTHIKVYNKKGNLIHKE